MAVLERWFGQGREAPMTQLYTAVVAEARRPEWYRAGGVPDTIDGRFDMISLVLAIVLLRMEGDGQAAALPSAQLAERFIEDMDGQLRETGFGDLGVGKQVGKAMGALGGRIGAYRDAITDEALIRNLWRGQAPTPAALAATRTMIEALQARVAAQSFDRLLVGELGAGELG